MREQLITFETAKLAKEKGFDIQCHWYFTHKRKFPTSEDTYYPNQTSKPQNWNDDSNLKFYERFSTPTQSLLQKWLREVHNIFVYPVAVFPVGHETVSYYDAGFRGHDLIERFESWEEAFEYALVYGLNKIGNEK